MGGVNLTLKNIPVEFMDGLRRQAKCHHRSLQGENMTILEEGIRPGRLTLGELRAEVSERA